MWFKSCRDRNAELLADRGSGFCFPGYGSATHSSACSGFVTISRSLPVGATAAAVAQRWLAAQHGRRRCDADVLPNDAILFHLWSSAPVWELQPVGWLVVVMWLVVMRKKEWSQATRRKLRVLR